MINYKHLHYFWVVARQGGIARAAERLHLTPQTISGQIGLLEDSVGKALFSRAGRNLELTEAGRLMLGYADEIFALGGELEAALRNLPLERQMVFKVGIADVVPKTIAYRLLAPALAMPDPVRLVCRENSLANLLAELALHRVDMVIADGPIPPGINVRGFSHVLGECGISFLAVPQLARPLRKGFPASLNGAPLLMPSETNLVQAKLLEWLDRLRISPRIVGEFDDSALMKVFGQAGTGIFIVSTPIAKEVAKQYGVQIIGSTEDVREQYFAISVERRISHPAVSAITKTAREWLNPAP
ncbi:MAG: transcriptional activator NhaR [Gammaproteobacteria bacterium]|nr:transcriptional activator NhaR [Gammaproteobacteria bacterium]